MSDRYVVPLRINFATSCEVIIISKLIKRFFKKSTEHKKRQFFFVGTGNKIKFKHLWFVRAVTTVLDVLP